MKIINYILAAIILILGLSKLLMPLVLLNIVGIILYIVTSIFLVIKPKVGYFLLLLVIVLMFLPYILYAGTR
jgi:hypothetical protein